MTVRELAEEVVLFWDYYSTAVNPVSEVIENIHAIEDTILDGKKTDWIRETIEDEMYDHQDDEEFVKWGTQLIEELETM